MGVNNLPRLLLDSDLGSNSRPLSHKSDDLATKLFEQPHTVIICLDTWKCQKYNSLWGKLTKSNDFLWPKAPEWHSGTVFFSTQATYVDRVAFDMRQK